MHTDQDEISTMVYEIFVLRKDELSDSNRKWITRLWFQDAPITLTKYETYKLFDLHAILMRGIHPRLSSKVRQDALGGSHRTKSRGKQISL